MLSLRFNDKLELNFKTNIIEACVDLNIDVIDLIDLTNLIRIKNSVSAKKFVGMATLSAGVVHYDTEISQVTETNMIDYVDALHFGTSGKSNTPIISYGVLLKYKVFMNFYVGLETSLRNVLGDKIDGWYSEGTANDKYSYTALNLSYIFQN